MAELQKHIIEADAPLYEALEALNTLSGDIMTLIAVDESGKVAGTLTDGDVRRALLRGTTLDEAVSRAMHRDFRWLSAREIDLEQLRHLRERGITLIPVLDDEGRITRLIDTRETTTILPLQAILMAGGKGVRLRPLTNDCPKPLLKVGEKAIIDYNVQALAEVGVTDITVTTNYLADKIENHFNRPVAGVDVKCVRETAPLGTLGAASLVELTPGGATLVMNSDLLTTLSIEEMYLTHRREKADVTIAAVPYNVQIPFAILATEGRRVTALEEKPTYSWYANAGIYIFNNDVLATLPHDSRTDAPDFIERVIAEGRKVVYHPIDGTWIDIGSPSDYAHACELMGLRNL